MYSNKTELQKIHKRTNGFSSQKKNVNVLLPIIVNTKEMNFIQITIQE